jgi:hypothetical protein
MRLKNDFLAATKGRNCILRKNSMPPVLKCYPIKNETKIKIIFDFKMNIEKKPHLIDVNSQHRLHHSTINYKQNLNINTVQSNFV